MPPFRSQRIDPYDDGTGITGAATQIPNTSLQRSGATWQRTLAGNSSNYRLRSDIRDCENGGHNGRLFGNGTQQPQHLGVNSVQDHSIIGKRNDGYSYLHRRYESVEARAVQQQSHYHYSVESGHSSQQQPQHYHHNESVVPSKTGAAPLSSQLHPLMELRRRTNYTQNIHTGENTNDYSDDENRGIIRPHQGRQRSHLASPLHNPNNATELITKNILLIIAHMLGFVPERKRRKKHDDSTLTTSIVEPAARMLRLIILISLLIYTTKRIIPSVVDKMTRPKPWAWSGGVSLTNNFVPRRNLAGRNCVINYFIEKQPPDEYDPDYVEIKPASESNKDGSPKTQPPPIQIVEGTYRTKGQVQVIARFIEAVASSFRSNTKVRQHLIFAEVRDSGHLAHEALKHWPPRGRHRVTVHVLASEEELPPVSIDNNNIAATAAARALGYGTLEDIELRFKGNGQARIYDRDGNIAGLPDTEGVDDDELLSDMMEMNVPDQETLDLRLKSGRRRLASINNTTSVSEAMRPYPNLRAILPFEDEDDGEGEVVVPYMHIDGKSMANQILVLESARSLFEDKIVVAVGIEHSPDMDVRVLVEFFSSVRYKIFYLGARQLARIDNLCEEVLDDVLQHPYVKKHDHKIRHFFIRLGFLSKEELRLSGDAATLEGRKRRETPPFFVAMPRGRKNKEEMTIQTMYDLFSGSGGGGQVKTANDRKAPGKK